MTTKESVLVLTISRPRPTPAPPQAKRPGNVPHPPQPTGLRTPMLGATITISIGELQTAATGMEEIQKAIAECDNTPSERLLRLGLKVRWEIGEAGAGGGWKTGDVRDESSLQLDPSSLSIDDVLSLATRDHAAHLTRHYATPLIANRTPLIEPTLETADSRPLVVRVPIPAQKRNIGLKVSVSPFTGLLEIEDEGAKFSASGGDERGNRTRLATNGVNTGMTPLGEALRRLVMAVSRLSI
jgi:mediator of RNA polymerase II transcription subunit 14